MDEKEWQQKQIDEAKAEIKEVYDLIDRKFGEVTTAVRDLIKEIKDNYQTKEMCKLCGGNRQKEIDALKDQNKWLTRSIIVGAVYVIYDLVRPFLGK